MAVLDDNTSFASGFGGSNAIFFLFILFLFGGGGWGGGFGGWGNNGFMNGWGSPMAQGTLTRADINEGFANNRILEKQDEITASLANNALNAQRDTLTSSYALRDDLGDKIGALSDKASVNTASIMGQASAIAAAQAERACNLKSDVLLGNAALNNSLQDAKFQVAQGINDTRYALATNQCETNHRIDMEGCGINRNIDASRFETVKQTGDIINAIHADGEATRALITGNVIQGLRDRLAMAENSLTSQTQVSQIVDRMRQTPTPSWMVQSPYQSYTPQVVVAGYTPSASYSYPGYYGYGTAGNGIG